MDSLAEVARRSRELFGEQVLLPADDEWFQYVHHRTPTPDGGTGFAGLYQHLERLNRAASGAPSAARPCVAPIQLTASVVLNSESGAFMAPMSCPLTRAEAHRLLRPAAAAATMATVPVDDDGDGEVGGVAAVAAGSSPDVPYWITEKSDGLRVILVSYLVRQFPRWHLQSSGPLRLDEIVILEGALNVLLAQPQLNETPQFSLFRGTFALRRQPGGGPGFELVQKAAVEGEQQRVVPFRRAIDFRHVSYLFDRSMSTAYLLCDEFPFVGTSLVIIDAELISIPQLSTASGARALPRPALAAFDLFCFESMEAAQKRVGGVQAAHWPPPTAADSSLVQLKTASMSQRYEQLGAVAIDPMVRASGGPSERCRVALFRKQMFPIGAVEECVALLRRRGERYFFAGPLGETPNDGLIFTPERFNIVAGSCPEQLKWKWPGAVTVDWVLEHARPPCFKVSMFFRLRRFDHRPDLKGNTERSDRMHLDNPHNLTLPPNGCIAECHFNCSAGRWTIERLRHDKKEANSVTTVISVVESAAEHLDLPWLLRLLGRDSAVPLEHLAQLCPPPPQRALADAGALPVLKPCKFVLNASKFKGSPRLHLRWLVKIPDSRNALKCDHRDVTQCFGLGEPCPADDPNSRLCGRLFIELANAGGSLNWSDTLVDAFFDSARGRWGIVSVIPHGNNNLAYNTQVIDHLEAVATQRAQFGAVPLPPELCTATADTSRSAASDAHYAAVTRDLRAADERSELRRWNNWIKAVLIDNAIAEARNDTGAADGNRVFVVDLCCGRGGDLQKWVKAGVRQLLMVDSCFEAVAEAATRYCVTPGLSTKVARDQAGFPGVPATFRVCDCFDAERITAVIEAERARLGGAGFDVVSCQFSMHYAFSSETPVRGLLSGIAAALRTGGVFVGTTVDDAVLDSRRRAALPATSFGNSVYRVDFEQPPADEGATHPRYGERYFATVESSVRGEPEYVVRWQPFVELAATNGLQLVESANFETLGAQFLESDNGLRLLADMTAKRSASDAPAAIRLTAEEREAARIYKGFIFRRV